MTSSRTNGYGRARAAQEAGLADLAFLHGIPGAVGGALRVNGGAYGRETETARKRVRETLGVELDWEIKRIGVQPGHG